MRRTIFIVTLVAATLACNFSTEDPEAIKSLERTKVAIELTQTAIAQPAPLIKVTTPTAAASANPTAPTVAAPAANGSISGKLSYPGSYIPPMSVCALSKEDLKKSYCILTVLNQQNYTIKDVPPGVYYVLAYYTVPDGDRPGAWSQMVPCGLSVNCTDHSLIAVTVKAGEAVTGIDPNDWYAPINTFPPKPGK